MDKTSIILFEEMSKCDIVIRFISYGENDKKIHRKNMRRHNQWEGLVDITHVHATAPYLNEMGKKQYMLPSESSVISVSAQSIANLMVLNH